jgi:hypothetical protein
MDDLQSPPCSGQAETESSAAHQAAQEPDLAIPPFLDRRAQGRESWRDHLPVHPAANLFPPMSKDELRELGEDIKANGLVSSIVLYKGKLLDGRNRLDAMELVGERLDRSRIKSLSNQLGESVDPHDFVIAANLHRRHLTGEQKREIIAKVLKAKPVASNRQIAKQVKADDKTVASVRRDLESTAEFPQLEKTVGADGKQRKSRAKKPEPVKRRVCHAPRSGCDTRCCRQPFVVPRRRPDIEANPSDPRGRFRI